MSEGAASGGAKGPVVVKIGGSTLGSHDTALADLAALHAEGLPLVVVHGGGDAVTAWLERHGVASRFVEGLRVTGADALDVVVAVLAGLVNKQLVAQLNALGARAAGLSGADGGLLRARRHRQELGFVGEITAVDSGVLHDLLAAGLLPVVAPIAAEDDDGRLTGQLLNVNADTVAGELARALSAAQLIFLTDVPGVLDSDGRLLERLSPAEAEGLLAAGTVGGGMIPKVQAALSAAAPPPPPPPPPPP